MTLKFAGMLLLGRCPRWRIIPSLPNTIPRRLSRSRAWSQN